MSNEGPNIALYQAGGFKATIGTKGGGIYFGTSGDTERLRITTDNVLIHTTDSTTVGTVNKNLVVGSTTNNHEVALTLNVMEGTNNRRVKFFLDDDDGVFGVDSTASTGVAPFVIRNAGTERLRITGGGQLVQTTTHTSGTSAHQNTSWYGDDADDYDIEVNDFNEVFATKTENSNNYNSVVYKREMMTQYCDMEFTFTGGSPGSSYRHFGILINGDGSDTSSNMDRFVYRVHPSSTGNNQVRLDKGGGGTGFNHVSSSIPNIFDESEHHVHLQIRKRHFTISVDGNLVWDTITDANLVRTQGYPGFIIYEASTGSGTWFKIRAFKIRNHTANAKSNSMYAGGNRFIQMSRDSGNSSETFTRAQMTMDDNEMALIYVTVSGTGNNLRDYGYQFFHWKMPRGTTSSITDNIISNYKGSGVSTFTCSASTSDLVVTKDSDLSVHVTIIGGGGRKGHVGW